LAGPDERSARAEASLAPEVPPPGARPRATPRRALAALAAAPLAFAAARAAAGAGSLLGVPLGAPAAAPPPALLAETPLRAALGVDPLASALEASGPGGPEVLAAVAALAAVLRIGAARRPPGAAALVASILWALGLALVLGLEVPRRRALAAAAAAAAAALLAARGAAVVRGPRPRAAAALALAALGALAVALQEHAQRAPLRSDDARADAPAGAGLRSVVLLTLDTTRRDALGCYGGDPRATPHLDALARESVIHDRAVSPSPHTHPAMASLLTGRSPLAHGSVSGAPFLADDATTLAEHLAAHGYRTAGFLDNPWLWGGFGLERGLQHLERSADLARVERWLDGPGRGGPFLLHVHLFQPHGPYELRGPREAPLPPAASRLGDRVDARVIRASEAPTSHAFTADEIAWMRTLYRSEVRAMDAWIGRLLDALDARGILDRCVLVVAADHGEEFGERGGLHHSHTVFGELVDVPLLVRAPDLAPRREAAVTSLESVAAITTELAGAPPLGPATAEESDVAVSVRVRQAGRHLLRARTADWALHARVTPGLAGGGAATTEFALFDLARDPGERVDVARDRPEVVASMRELPPVSRALAALAGLPIARGGRAQRPSARAAADLDALGYSR